MRVLLAGVAGLIGSHLAEALVDRGDHVVGVDDFITGRPGNLARLTAEPRFTLMVADVASGVPVDGTFDAVLHLASPASPVDFGRLGVDILRAGSVGTLNLLEIARASQGRFLLASTSEVYGEPAEHPQSERYRGNVSTTGPRACYDEAKRFAEAAASTYEHQYGVQVRIARIFNTYGPRLRPDDGRVVSNFISQGMSRVPLTICGTGLQTRSFCYVDDQVRGLVALLDSDVTDPVNIGNDEEITIAELARLVSELTGGQAPLRFIGQRDDDPVRRRPDLGRARRLLGWEPEVSLEAGLVRTLDWFRANPDQLAPTVPAPTDDDRSHGVPTAGLGARSSG